MATYTKYTTPVDVDDARFALERRGRRFVAILKAAGTSFFGSGDSVIEAIHDVLKAVDSEKRAALRNPGKRYRVAVSLGKQGVAKH